MKIKFKGLKEVKKAIADGRKDAIKKLRKGLQEGGKIVKAEARNLVPQRSGQLRRSISMRTKTYRTKCTVTMSVKREDAYYFSFVEFGTKKQRAQHYMEYAAKNKEAEVRRAALDSIKDLI